MKRQTVIFVVGVLYIVISTVVFCCFFYNDLRSFKEAEVKWANLVAGIAAPLLEDGNLVKIQSLLATQPQFQIEILDKNGLLLLASSSTLATPVTNYYLSIPLINNSIELGKIRSYSGNTWTANKGKYLAYLFVWALTLISFLLSIRRILDLEFLAEFAAKLKVGSVAQFNTYPERFRPLIDAALNYGSMVQKNSQLENELVQNQVVAKMAAQVAHDIRSPLSALNMISSVLDGVAEEKRLIIRNATKRINDIANQLLIRSRQSTQEGNSSPIQMSGSLPVKKEIKSIELISSSVEILVTEKRAQYRDRLGIEIELELCGSYGVFAQVDVVEFKRALSNLIDNSVEALLGDQGIIVIRVIRSGELIKIEIEDNGKGIPEVVLGKLGQQGFSFGKSYAESGAGSGLGIYHAKTTVEALGGNLQIYSNENVGTKVIIHLKRAETPSWFVERIFVNDFQTIICVDDDKSVHHLWQGRFKSTLGVNSGIEIVSLSSGRSLSDWLGSAEKHITKNALYLVDFEFFGCTENGLDLIESFKLSEQAVLVTNRFEEIEIRNRCRKLGVRMIPKSMVNLIPIQFIENEQMLSADFATVENDSTTWT